MNAAIACASAFRPLRATTHALQPRVVLTGFGAFPGVPRNATAEMIEAIARAHGIALRSPSRRFANFRVGRGELALASGRAFASLIVLPVAWDAAAEIVIAEARAMRASLVLMSGVAPIRSIFVERGSSNARKKIRDAFGARLHAARVRPLRRGAVCSIDVVLAKSAAEHALADEMEKTPELARVIDGVACRDVRADNAYVCNATTHAFANARVRGARYGFLHWPSALEAHNADGSARVLLAIADALTVPRAAEAG